MGHTIQPSIDTPRSWGRLIRALLVGVLASAVLLPVDGAISRWVQGWRPTGDLRRELELLQQFGSPTTIVIAGLLIWRLDPARLRRMLDWIAAALIASGAMFLLKISAGRLRPKFGEPTAFLGPAGTHVVKEGDPARHAWEFWHDDVAELWSLPSSHTVAATVAALFLSRTYPSLRPIVCVIVILVGVCRVLFNAHYPSDVVLGATLGYVLGALVIDKRLGERLIGLKDERTDPAPS